MCSGMGTTPNGPCSAHLQGRDSQVLTLSLGTPRGAPPDGLYPRHLAPAPTVDPDSHGEQHPKRKMRSPFAKSGADPACPPITLLDCGGCTHLRSLPKPVTLLGRLQCSLHHTANSQPTRTPTAQWSLHHSCWLLLQGSARGQRQASAQRPLHCCCHGLEQSFPHTHTFPHSLIFALSFSGEDRGCYQLFPLLSLRASRTAWLVVGAVSILLRGSSLDMLLRGQVEPCPQLCCGAWVPASPPASAHGSLPAWTGLLQPPPACLSGKPVVVSGALQVQRAICDWDRCHVLYYHRPGMVWC